MSQNKYGLSLRPNIRVHNVRPWHLIFKPKSHPHFVRYSLITVFAVGVIFGGGVVANDKLSQADQLAGRAPQIAGSATTEPWSKPLEFSTQDLNIVTDMLPLLIEEARHVPSSAELANIQRREVLREYFVNRKSPFANHDETLDAFLNSNNMKLMIAISFVESTMGQRCYYNNCSGIGGYPPNLRKYDTHADWVRDFDSLLERRYKGMKPEDMMGIYVQPGSPNWINGVRQILAELEKQGIE